MMILDLKTDTAAKLKKLAALLAQGEVIAYPTETVYGLGCDATNQAAVEKIYSIKGKDKNKQLLVLVGSRAMAEKYFEFNALSRRLARRYWPGALSMILPVRPEFLGVFGQEKVGVRLSSNRMATSLSRRLGRPIISTSANPSGQPAALSGEQVQAYFKNEAGMIAALADGGALEPSLGSTVVDASSGEIKLIRQGAVEIIGKI
ncbi:threonylcarbamoyl-AMP synthase [Candidatus Falkowbacteria bacterium]|nr:threonylcarbamoyl-AMP synthase [Candidatus Falkowbacteria bacterium]